MAGSSVPDDGAERDDTAQEGPETSAPDTAGVAPADAAAADAVSADSAPGDADPSGEVLGTASATPPVSAAEDADVAGTVSADAASPHVSAPDGSEPSGDAARAEAEEAGDSADAGEVTGTGVTGQANRGKDLTREAEGARYARVPIRTHTVMRGDDLDRVILDYAPPVLQQGDLLFVTEKIVAITQGRSFLLEEIRPRKLAHVLSKYVTRTPHGIGLGMPETMEMALRECGTPRILFAAAVAAVTKAFGRKGDFYRIAGDKARSIDGPTEGTIPPYDRSVVLGPERPREVSAHLKELLGGAYEVAVVDINDLGGNILGSTLDRAGEQRLLDLLRDNPLGQGAESTPMGVIRKAEA